MMTSGFMSLSIGDAARAGPFGNPARHASCSPKHWLHARRELLARQSATADPRMQNSGCGVCVGGARAAASACSGSTCRPPSPSACRPVHSSASWPSRRIGVPALPRAADSPDGDVGGEPANAPRARTPALPKSRPGTDVDGDGSADERPEALICWARGWGDAYRGARRNPGRDAHRDPGRDDPCSSSPAPARELHAEPRRGAARLGLEGAVNGRALTNSLITMQPGSVMRYLCRHVMVCIVVRNSRDRTGQEKG
eukprot:366074-Chlamydomonas_euryale.AAC.17